LLLGKKEHSTCGAGTAHPSGAPDFIPSFEWGLCYFVFSIMCMLCRSLFFLLVIVLSVLLRFMDSDYPFGIFKLFLPKLELKYCPLNFNSAGNVTNIQFKIILVKQTDNGQIEDDGCQVIAKADNPLGLSGEQKENIIFC
jgi:hypothetical protein